MKGEKEKTKKMSLAWCESMKGQKGKEKGAVEVR